MILQINEKEYEIYFGVAFVRALDEKYSTPGAGGTRFGIGLETFVSKLYAGDTVALSEILYAGTASEKTRPTQKLIDQYVLGDGFNAFYSRTRTNIDELVKTDPNALYSYDEYVAGAEMLKKTVKAVKAFNRDYGLGSGGEVTQKTVNKMAEAAKKARKKGAQAVPTPAPK